MIELKPCPFCGMSLDSEEPDVIYPSGLYWREDGGIRHYVSHKYRLADDNSCYSVHCPIIIGGCGVEMTGDSLEEAVKKWNTRA